MDQNNSNPLQLHRRQVTRPARRCSHAVALLLLVGLITLGSCMQSAAFAAGLSGIKPEDVVNEYPDKPWHLSADEVSYDQKANVYIARGNVELGKLS